MSTQLKSPVLAASQDAFIPLGVSLPDNVKTSVADLMARLTAPFAEADVDWLLKEEDVARGADGVYRGRCFPYINARAVQHRLDEVFGPYWSTKMCPTAFGGGGRAGVICELSVYLPGTGWLTKSDACDLSQIEPVRGGASGALKRVAVQFGIGRYLYSLTESSVTLSPKIGSRRLKIDSNTVLFWDPPMMPLWALPESERPAREQQLAEITRKAAAEAERLSTESDGAKKIAPAIAAVAEVPVPVPVPPSAPIIKANPEMAPAETAQPLCPTNTVNRSNFDVLPSDILGQLNAILGEDQQLAVEYLKFKRLLPATASLLSELQLDQARSLIANAETVRSRMQSLNHAARLVQGQHEAATSYFTGQGFIKAGQPWFAANDVILKKFVAESAAFTTGITPHHSALLLSAA